MNDDHLGAGVRRESVVGAVPEPRATQAAGGEHQLGLAEVGVGPRRRHQLAAMVSVHSLGSPAHRVRGTQVGEELIVVQDHFHHDMLTQDGGHRAGFAVADR